MNRRLLVVSLTGLLSLPTAAADNIDRIGALLQSDFRGLSQDLGAALSYKAVAPAEPLGVVGFDIGVELTATKLQHREAWGRASSGRAPDTVYIPKLHVHKGLPAGFDIAAFYSAVPNTNIELWGAELRYALLQGGVAAPALGLRGTYSRVTGVEQLDFSTRGVEIGISKGFTLITPYAGIGRVWVESEPRVGTLVPEEFSDAKLYAGANFNFVLGNLALEADRVGDTASYSAKFGFRF